MMRDILIHKHTLERPVNRTGPFDVTLPAKSKIISAIVQNGAIQLYYERPTREQGPAQTWIVHVIATGERHSDLAPHATFLATLIQHPFVWHLYIEAPTRSES